MRCLVEYASVLLRSGLIRLARFQQALGLIFTVIVWGKHMELPAPDYFWKVGDSFIVLWGCSGKPGSLGIWEVEYL